MTPIGLPDRAKSRTNPTASSSVRRKSGLATPPGSSSASNSSAETSLAALSAVNVSPLSRWLKPWNSPASTETSTTSAPSFSTALRGSVNSTCSTPSAARIAIFFPFNLPMSRGYRAGYGTNTKRKPGDPGRRQQRRPRGDHRPALQGLLDGDRDSDELHRQLGQPGWRARAGDHRVAPGGHPGGARSCP